MSKSSPRRAGWRPGILARRPLVEEAPCGAIALTECGVVNSVNVNWEVLESRYFITTRTAPDRVRRSWKGFVSTEIYGGRAHVEALLRRKISGDQRMPISPMTERINGALTGKEREAGLDIISRSGMIRLELSE